MGEPDSHSSQLSLSSEPGKKDMLRNKVSHVSQVVFSKTEKYFFGLKYVLWITLNRNHQEDEKKTCVLRV